MAIEVHSVAPAALHAQIASDVHTRNADHGALRCHPQHASIVSVRERGAGRVITMTDWWESWTECTCLEAVHVDGIDDFVDTWDAIQLVAVHGSCETERGAILLRCYSDQTPANSPKKQVLCLISHLQAAGHQHWHSNPLAERAAYHVDPCCAHLTFGEVIQNEAVWVGIV